jgi:hypothetical protein
LIVRPGRRDRCRRLSWALPTRTPDPNPSGGRSTVRTGMPASFGSPGRTGAGPLGERPREGCLVDLRDLRDGTPRALVGWKKPTTVRKEQTPGSVRNAERGTYRDLGTPGKWTSGTTSAEGDKTLGELAMPACRRGSRLRSYSEEEAEAQESRARCFAHQASRWTGRPQEPRKAEGDGSETQLGPYRPPS